MLPANLEMGFHQTESARVLDFLASRTMKTKFLLFTIHPVHVIHCYNSLKGLRPVTIRWGSTRPLAYTDGENKADVLMCLTLQWG